MLYITITKEKRHMRTYEYIYRYIYNKIFSNSSIILSFN